MIILGIDPGLATTGYGVINKDNRAFRHVAHGAILTKKSDAHEARLLCLSRALKKIVKQFHPRVAAVEELFIYKNLKTAMFVSQARGAILLTLAECRIPVYQFTPLEVKQALTGYGRAEKLQMQKMVKTVLGLLEIPKPDDAADALAVALCYAQTSEAMSSKA